MKKCKKCGQNTYCIGSPIGFIPSGKNKHIKAFDKFYYECTVCDYIEEIIKYGK